MENSLTYRPAIAEDWPAIETMLLSARLPLDGARDHLAAFVVGESDGVARCVGGYERYGDVALLRSVAIAKRWRGQGIGSQLLQVLKGRAHADGIGSLYLLTTTAADFFARHGFIEVDRATAPAVLQGSREFQGVCPASATLMVTAPRPAPGPRA